MGNYKDWLKAHPEEALPKKDHWRMEIFETEQSLCNKMNVSLIFGNQTTRVL